MLIKENKELPEAILAVHRKKIHVRSKWHLTDLLRPPRVLYYFMTGVEPRYSDATLLTFARGHAHHGVLQVFPLTEIPREKDGVKMTIDMIHSSITEIFTTTMSSNKVKVLEDVPKVFPDKVDQLKGYVYASGETHGDLLVFHLFGDYSRFTDTPVGLEYTGIEPELKSWTLFFEESELKEFWDGILANKAYIELCLKTSTIPDCEGDNFKCNRCPFSYICPDAKMVDNIDVEKAKIILATLESAVERIKEKEKTPFEIKIEDVEGRR